MVHWMCALNSLRNSWLYCDHWVYGFHCYVESFLTEIEEGASVYFCHTEVLLQYEPHSLPSLKSGFWIFVSRFSFQDSQIHWSSASLFPEYSRKKSEVLLEIDFSCRNAFFSQILYLSSLNRHVDNNHSARILFNRSNQHQILPKMWKIDRHNTRFFVLRYLYQFL